MATIELLSTDFDGTLIGHPSDGRACAELREALDAFKRAGGIWAVNTGRTLAHAVEGVALLNAPVQPDYLITCERHIHRRGPGGDWLDFGEWNALCDEQHERLFRSCGATFERVIEFTAQRDDVTLIYEDGKVAGLVTSDDVVMEEVTLILDAERDEEPDFAYQRNGIYLRFCHAAYDKGTSLSELARLLGISKSRIMAAGDHYNDLPMLNGSHAAFAACPSNAIDSVASQVRQIGGYAAAAEFGAGVAEAITAVCSQTNGRPA